MVHRGRARDKPENHCPGSAGLLRRTRGDYARVLSSIRTRGCGCEKHPAFPAPSSIEGDADAELGQIMPREYRSVPSPSLRADGSRIAHPITTFAGNPKVLPLDIGLLRSLRPPMTASCMTIEF